MKRRTAWILVGMVAAISVGAAAVGGAVLLLSGRGPSAPWAGGTKRSLYLDLDGPLPERYFADLGSFLEKRPASLRAIVESLDRAAVDPSVSGAVIRIGFLPDAGWGKLQELRAAIERFRRSGKPASAYLEVVSNKEYYLATACSKIYALPTAILDISGLRMEVLFLRQTLDKLGIQAQFEGVGKYKNAPNQFTESSFTPPHREQMEALLDSLFGEYVRAIGKARQRDEAQVRALLDAGPYDGRRAKEAGLIDDLLYEDQLPHEDSRLSPARYVRSKRSPLFDSRPKLAVVYAVGEIVDGESQQDGFGGELAGSKTVTEALRQARTDDDVRAIVLRVDSPGGSGPASNAMWREMRLAAQAKPVIVSMGDYAASGGYYIAMAGSGIVAQPGTFTGSIGVFSGKFSLRGFYDKIGVTKEILKRGRYASLFSEYRPWNEDERGKIREMNAAFYKDFIAKVAESRKKSVDEIDSVAQGRVWTGADARERGLVDRLGGLSDAIEWAKDKANIAKGQDVAIVVLPEQKSLFETLWERQEEAVQQRVLPRELVSTLRFLTAFGEQRVLARLPFDVSVR